MMARTQFPVVLISLALLTSARANTIRSDLIRLTVDGGRYVIQAPGQGAPFASGTLGNQGVVKNRSVRDDVFGKGQAINVTAANGAVESFQIFPGLPFVLHRSILVNTGTAPTVLNKVPGMEMHSGPGPSCRPIGGPRHWRPQASGGDRWAVTRGLRWLTPVPAQAWSGGWLTHERGSGVVFTQDRRPSGQPGGAPGIRPSAPRARTFSQ